jgi:ribosomal protein S18 acetylase RimI-like enzyme
MATVRDAEPADAAAVAEIGRVAVPRQYDGLIPPATFSSYVRQGFSDLAIEKSIRAYATDSTAHFLVVEEGGRILGFLQYDESGMEPELHRIYLDPREVGQGLGTMLMEGLHERLGLGVTYILLVVDGNEGAIRFYERLGLTVERNMMGIPYYSSAGITFPEGAGDFVCLVMRYQG